MNKTRFFYFISFALLFTYAIGQDHGSFTDPRDGQTYGWVRIGHQVWMAENLNYEVENSWCYKNDPELCKAYGRLYNWHTAMSGTYRISIGFDYEQGLCPPGWHMPKHEEWRALLHYIEGQGYPNKGRSPEGVGNTLKSCRTKNSSLGAECDTSEHPYFLSNRRHHGLDKYDFGATPGGFRHIITGSFTQLGKGGWWWSSSDTSNRNARAVAMFHNRGYLHFSVLDKYISVSVRCIKNYE